MSPGFLDLVHEGKNEWWRYVLGVLIIVLLWFGVTVVLYFGLGVWVAVDGNPDTYFDTGKGALVGLDSYVHYAVLNMGHVAMLAGLFLVVRFLHKRPFRTLVTGEARIKGRMLAKGFALYFVLLGLFTIVDFVLSPSTYRVTQNPARFLIMAPLVLILTPVQTTTEELVFRGYLMQGAGLITRRLWFPPMFSSAVFLLPHLANPEVAHGPVAVSFYYFGTGLFFCAITIRSNSLELAMGAHAAMNLFAALVVNYADSVLETESLFFCNKVDPFFVVTSFVVMTTIFYGVTFGFRKADPCAEDLGPSSPV